MRVRRWPEEKPRLETQTKVATALLLYLSKHRAPIEPKSVYGPLAELMKVPPEHLLVKRADGRRAWPNLVQWARKQLVDEGLMRPPPPIGQWSLTEAGRIKAETLPATPHELTEEDLWGTSEP
jgi:hypothetical protein